MNSDSATFWQHIEELRTLLIRSFLVIAIGFALCLFGYGYLFDALLYPLHTQKTIQISTVKEIRNTGTAPVVYFLEGNNITLQPGDSTTVTIPDKDRSLVILSPLEGMTTMIKLCFWTALVATSPIWLYFIFLFISPAFERQTLNLIVPFLLLLISFGLCGLVFAYWFTIPIANLFLASFNSEIGLNFWSLSHYVDYSVLLLLSHAFIFELAAVLLMLVHFGVIGYEALSSKRRHACLTSFIIAAIVTPPDVFTQVALGVPMVIMYELIILYGRIRAGKQTQAVVTP